jgi:hypothetical protein
MALAQPSSNLKQVCTKVNPVLFEKDVTIEEIHSGLKHNRSNHKLELFKPTDHDVALKIIQKINNLKSKY